MTNQNPATAAEPGLLDLLRLKFTKQGSRFTPEVPEDADEPDAPAVPVPRTLISQPQPFRVVSAKGLALIKQFEGLRLKAYKCPAGVWTIGYGETRGIRPGMVWTREQAEKALVEGVKPYVNTVAKAIGKTQTTQNELDSMVSFCYNVGPGNFLKSSVLKYHLRGQKKLAADALMKWVKGGGQTLPGLVRRRRAERALYLA